jgi:hypothetical protein
VKSTIEEFHDTSVIDSFGTPVATSFNDQFDRWSVYAYETIELWEQLRLTAGLSYDRINYPANLRFPPFSDEQESRDLLAPKASLTWDLTSRVTLRGMYAQSLGGLSFEDSVRLEPTQLAGFSQNFRTLVSETEAGSPLVPKHELSGTALDLKLSANTFLGLEAQWLRSVVSQRVGTFNSFSGIAPGSQAIPSTTTEHLRYRERALTATFNRLLGDYWSLRLGYRLAESELQWSYPQIPDSVVNSPDRVERALLHQYEVGLQFQHPAGFFARAQSRWFLQSNEGYGPSNYTAPRGDESTFQLDLFAGWRFFRRRTELTFGCLNVTDQDYRLNSLTPYRDLPRERVWMGRVKLEF